ncbi:MAG: pitrilysin family protein [Oscillospiraceae bacterium]|nr:pitrilysin family protein [Oscillospiraceae bacterium]MDD4414026.1 pitrilysin family protein [Oscillospiraceae bacterium]
MEKQILENGLCIVYLPIEGAYSASVGIWVSAGSRHENIHEQGISHFIEHMLFKGTATRSSKDISEEMDSLGGGINAYTTKEYTRYYAQTLAENAVSAMDILCDMLLNPLIDPDELERERGVILDEMAMYEDSGEDVANEALYAAVWPNSPLGRPICGIKKTVSGFTSDDLRGYIRNNYTPERMIAVVAGSFDRDGMDTLIQNTLGSVKSGGNLPKLDVPEFIPSLALTKKRFEQTSLAIAMPGLPSEDKRRYAMMVLNFIVGGGASSRLFQRLREELGLAYSVYSSHSASKGTGLFTVLASFSADRQERVLTEINNVLKGLLDGVTEEEFDRARAQIKASNIMGLETVAARASFAGHNELFEGRQITSEEILDNLNSLTRSDIDMLAADVIGNPARALSVAGNTKSRSFYKGLLSFA